MDVQLKELIDKIKNDGVKSAEENAGRIIADAETRAQAIVAEAQAKAAKVRETAKADAEKAERSGREALRQAGRDLVLTVKSEIESLFDKVVTAEAGAVLDGSLMADSVAKAIEALAAEDKDLDVMIPEASFDSLEKGLRAKLAGVLSSGVEIKPFRDLEAGFRISLKDGSAFYDFSDAEIAAMLGRYLNARLARALAD